MSVQQVAPQIVRELRGGDALKGKVIKVATQEGIKSRAAEGFLEAAQQQRAFFKRYDRKDGFRIAPAQIRVQRLIGRTQPRHFACQILSAQRRLHFLAPPSINLLDNAPLDIARE